AYTITHHTRQSAVGLPQLVKRQFEGREYTMTEYTMSEIVGSVYEYQERTGHREGILFIDEINCVSETLAPTMLQFLQYKTFGSHKVPEGWIIVAAGNPPECNRSVRELDMAALDRVRTLDVEADFTVWRDYAQSREIHPTILSYLQLHPEHFYKVTLTRDKQEFVTARGWEDLSVVLYEYERQKMSVGRSFVEEFLRIPKIAADFAAYYEICRHCLGQYQMKALADGELSRQEEIQLIQKLQNAGGDVRCMFVRHLLSFASEQMKGYGICLKISKREQQIQEQYISYCKSFPKGTLEDFLEKRNHALSVKRENALLKPWEEMVEKALDEKLPGLLLGNTEPIPHSDLEQKKEKLGYFLHRMTDFLLEAFGEDLELSDWLSGLRNHGDYRACGFTRPEFDDLLKHKNEEERLRKQMIKMEELYETDDRI
ncbi:MAG: ATPase, partial [Lachnospiraceae bacterium]|nr:ATPase [Lachnospiraceae bacterium]